MEYFKQLQHLGENMDEKDKENMKRLGEKFYGNIDMDKYAPKPPNEAVDPLDNQDIRKIKYFQLEKALISGLLEEDLDDEEKELLKDFRKQ